MDMLDDVEFQVAKLELGQTGILAVRAAKPLTSVVAEELRARLERMLNLPGRVLVTGPGTDLTVIARLEMPLEAKGEPPRTEARVDPRRNGKG